MKKTITKLLLTGLLCTAAWQINSAKPVQAEELSVAYAQADQVDKSKVTELILPKEGNLVLMMACFRRVPGEEYKPEIYRHIHACNPLYNYPNLKRIKVEEGSSQFECRDGILYSYPEEKETKRNQLRIQCVPMNYEGVVHIGKDVIGIGEAAFDQCEKVTAFVVEEGNSHFYSKDGVLYEKIEDDGDRLVAYPAGKREERFTIPSAVMYIRNAAFAYNKYLKEITFCEDVENILPAAFENCTSLERVNNLPKELKTIGNCAFEGCEKLQLFDLPKNLTNIYGHAFEGIPAVKKIVFPVKCKEVEDTGLKMMDGGVMEAKGPWLYIREIPKEGNYIFKGYKETSLYKTMKKMPNVTCQPYKDSLYKHKTKRIKKGVKGKGKPSVSWYKKKKKVLYIKNPDQLAGIQKLLKKGIDFKGKKVVLKKDLDMSCYKNFTPLGAGLDSTKRFNGIFDGNGKTIYNLSIHRYEKSQIGLFSVLKGTVRDLKLKGTNVYGRLYVGGIAGNLLYGKIENCKVSGTVKGYHYINKIGAYFWDNVEEY